MYKQIYPVIGDEKNLPFYVVGLGLESWQFPIKRADDARIASTEAASSSLS